MTNEKDEFNFDFGDRALEGKTILVAGGSGGLGSSVSALLARDGANLIVGFNRNRSRAERLKRKIEKTYGADIQLVEGDIANPAVRTRYIEMARATEEGLYGLVCLVGDPARVKFDEVKESDLLDSIEKNYVGPILLAREAAAEMKRIQTQGGIVLFSTMQAVALFESSINYAGPKSALVHAARIMAKQWGGTDGIRVNVVAPGVNRAGMALESIASGKYDFFVREGIIHRFGRAEDIARVVRLLIEPDNYLTGQVITVDGGLTLRK
jgi:3-oxoacyl-[acyl-carrier protein] reductase